MARLDAFLRLVVDQKASDLHFYAGARPVIRVNGDLLTVNFRVISRIDCLGFFDEILTPEQKARFAHRSDIDLAYHLPHVARFRVNLFRHNDGIGGAFRIIPDQIATIEELQLPPQLRWFGEVQKGLVLVTGPTGSGKSTTLAAIIDLINSTQSRHILTIEDPIEFVHGRKKSVISQRQVGEHTTDFASGLRSATRGAADVILIGEMRDPETIAMALTCAETGSLVFGTLHTSSAAKAVNRIIDVFNPERQAQVRTMLSMSLQGVIAQQLVKRADGRGRVAAVEILKGSPALANMIRENKIHQIAGYIEGADGRTGMQSLDRALLDLLNRKLIRAETAMEIGNDKGRFRQFL